jgi:hypothetical protein
VLGCAEQRRGLHGAGFSRSTAQSDLLGCPLELTKAVLNLPEGPAAARYDLLRLALLHPAQGPNALQPEVKLPHGTLPGTLRTGPPGSGTAQLLRSGTGVYRLAGRRT